MDLRTWHSLLCVVGDSGQVSPDYRQGRKYTLRIQCPLLCLSCLHCCICLQDIDMSSQACLCALYLLLLICGMFLATCPSILDDMPQICSCNDDHPIPHVSMSLQLSNTSAAILQCAILCSFCAEVRTWQLDFICSLARKYILYLWSCHVGQQHRVRTPQILFEVR